MAFLDSGGPIEFLIPRSGDDYLDLANTMLHVQVKVTRANGDDLDLADPPGVQSITGYIRCSVKSTTT